MMPLEIGVFLRCLKLEFDAALDKCREIGATGIQLRFKDGVPVPQDEVGALRRKIEAKGLTVCAMCTGICDLNAYAARETWARGMGCLLDYTERIGAGVITGHIGRIPSDADDPVYAEMLSMMRAAGELCAARGIVFAIETGPEDAETLAGFVKKIDRGVRVNFDPANLIMGGYSKNGADCVDLLGGYTVSAHAKDAVFDGRGGKDVRIGTGEVDFPAWTAALRRAGFEGFLIIEREEGDDRVADIAAGAEYLKKLI